MATLKAEMGIAGVTQGGEELTEVLDEISPDGKGKRTNIMNDDIEEKDSAIQMLIVFIEELGAGCGQYIE